MRQKISTIATLMLAAFLALFAFAGTAFAAGEVTPNDGSLLDLARPVFDQVMAGHYFAATCLALVLAVALLKRYATTGKVGTFVHSDVGGLATTFAMAFFGAAATAAIAGGSWSWALIRTAGGVGAAAIGGYTAAKILYAKLTESAWYAAKAPAWLKPIVALFGFVLDKPSAVKNAQAAGDAAVKANPAPGAGKPTEVP